MKPAVSSIVFCLWMPVAVAQSAPAQRCEQDLGTAQSMCAPQSADGQSGIANDITTNVGTVEEGGVQAVGQTSDLSEQVYNAALALAARCQDSISVCEQSCRTSATEEQYQTCHHDLREKLYAMKADANAAVMSRAVSARSQAAMTADANGSLRNEPGAQDYAMGPRKGSFSIDVTSPSGPLTDEQKNAYAAQFNSNKIIDSGTDGEFNGNRVQGTYDSTVTPSQIRNNATAAAQSMGLNAQVGVTPDAPTRNVTSAPQTPEDLVNALRPKPGDDLTKPRTPRLGRPAYCAQTPWQIGC